MSPQLFDATVKAILRQVAAHRNMRWELSGGEPTLHPELFSLIRHLKTLDCAPTPAPYISLITNGLKLSDDKFCHDLAQSGLNRIRVTVLGPRSDIHDYITRMPGSHTQTICGLRNLVEAAPATLEVCAHLVATKENASVLAETVLWLSRFGIKSISLNRAIPPWGRTTNAFQVLPLADYSRLADEAKKIAQREGIPFQSLHHWPPCIPVDASGTRQNRPCGLGFSLLVIEPDGTLIGCDFYPVTAERLGHDLNVMIWKALCEFRRERGKQRPAVCNKCSDWKSCGGPCPVLWHELFGLGNELDKKGNVPCRTNSN